MTISATKNVQQMLERLESTVEAVDERDLPEGAPKGLLRALVLSDPVNPGIMINFKGFIYRLTPTLVGTTPAPEEELDDQA